MVAPREWTGSTGKTPRSVRMPTDCAGLPLISITKRSQYSARGGRKSHEWKTRNPLTLEPKFCGQEIVRPKPLEGGAAETPPSDPDANHQDACGP
ncbi:hypothetical protein EVAR_34350_1 [Eumeta japonica]|uniref:Uncharacterized protein n=1 Tax=Eumeta variegata TaxID=151549 RepID=A0A4C1VD93_EUMVA|nr:hypothetical protein EVAR_34350_1 [Eumeta japonica]